MTGDEAKEAMRRLHTRISPVLNDRDKDIVAAYLQGIWADGFEEGRKNRPAPFQIREVKGLPNGRAWEMT